MYLLLKGPAIGPVRPAIEPRRSADEGFERIRCPQCQWRPTRNSRWSCVCGGTPEPSFEACGTVWNTFETRGRCPGCHHQWIWTSCLRCAVASLHEDWYERSADSRPY
jgi:hypothetical protein